MPTSRIGTSNPRMKGEKLKGLRKEAGYSQQELADFLGISRETVCAIENNKPESLRSISVEVMVDWSNTCVKRIRAKSGARAEMLKLEIVQFVTSLFNK
jgi:DNA-binding XRE family transcriptional regulator